MSDNDTAEGDATIQAVDTDDDTIYVLRVSGEAVAVAPWPHMLEALRPDARRIEAHGLDKLARKV